MYELETGERVKIEYVIGSKKYYGQEIRKKGRVNISKLYDELVPWFHEFKYRFIEKGITGRARPEGRYEKIDWRCSRKIDAYFRFHIEVLFIIYRIKDNTAELTLRFKGYLHKDYRDRFAKRFGKLGEFLRRIYEAYIVKDKVENMKDKLRIETNLFIDRAKRILDAKVRSS